MPDFDWILELPDGWEPPDELRTPSMSIEANLAIRMLSCDYLGHEVRVLLGRFITEHSLFTLWYLREAKSSRYGLKETLMLGGLPRRAAKSRPERARRGAAGGYSEPFASKNGKSRTRGSVNHAGIPNLA